MFYKILKLSFFLEKKIKILIHIDLKLGDIKIYPHILISTHFKSIILRKLYILNSYFLVI